MGFKKTSLELKRAICRGESLPGNEIQKTWREWQDPDKRGWTPEWDMPSSLLDPQSSKASLRWILSFICNLKRSFYNGRVDTQNALGEPRLGGSIKPVWDHLRLWEEGDSMPPPTVLTRRLVLFRGESSPDLPNPGLRPLFQTLTTVGHASPLSSCYSCE